MKQFMIAMALIASYIIWFFILRLFNKPKNEKLITDNKITDNKITRTDCMGTIRTYDKLTNKLHSFNDEPAAIYPDGAKFWYKEGKWHRDNDLPAIIHFGIKSYYKEGEEYKPDLCLCRKETDGNGTTKTYKDNLLHSFNDEPAVIYPFGRKHWFKEGKVHRDNDLPAIIHSNGGKEWYKEGKLHRDNDLPAIEYSNGYKVYYKENEKYEPCRKETDNGLEKSTITVSVSSRIRPTLHIKDGSRIFTIAISPDGKKFATGDSNHKVKLYKISGELIETFHAESSVYALVFKDDDCLISGEDNGTIRSFNLNGASQCSWKGHSNTICCLDVNKDGLLVSGSGDGRLKFWKDHQLQSEIDNHSEWILNAKFIHDNKIAAGSSIIKIIDVETKKEIARLSERNCDFFDFSKDGKYVATRHDVISVSDATSLKHLYNIDSLLDASAIRFSPNSKFLIASYQGDIKIYNVSTQQNVITINAHEELVDAMEIVPNSNLLITACDGELKMWNLKDYIDLI